MEFQPDDLDEIMSAINEINSLVRKLNEQDKWFDENLANLSQAICDEFAQAETLKQEVEELGHTIGELTRENVKDDSTMKTLQDQVDKLCEEWKVLRHTFESDTLLSRFGLIAVYVEQAICSHVLPEIFMNDAGASLHCLLDLLNGDDKRFPLDPNKYDYEKILCEARKRWENVCKSFDFPDEWKTKMGGWSVSDCTVPGDIRTIEVLKLSGVSITYPNPISLKYAEENVEYIKDEMPPWQFELVDAFIYSLRDKIMKSGLHYDKLLLD